MSKMHNKEKLEILLTNFNLEDCLQEVFDMMRFQAEAKGLKFQILIGMKQSRNMIKSDRSRFKSVLLNLITNAIKFTVQGSVTVKLHF